jgi:hypothetical protein
MAVDVDKIRVLVGDDDADTQILDDDAIGLIVDGFSSDYLAAAAVADAIAARFSRKVDFRLEGLSFSNSQKAEAYLKLAQRLRVQANNEDSSTMGAVVTGVSSSDMADQRDNDDRVQNLFEVGMQQDPAVKGDT